MRPEHEALAHTKPPRAVPQIARPSIKNPTVLFIIARPGRPVNSASNGVCVTFDAESWLRRLRLREQPDILEVVRDSAP